MSCNREVIDDEQMYNRESRLFIESYEHDEDLLDDQDLNQLKEFVELQEGKSPLKDSDAGSYNQNNN